MSLHGTCHEIDPALSSSYASHVLAGKPLHLPFQSLVVTKHVLTQPNFTLNLVRGFTRLKQVYVTFHKANDKAVRDFHHPVGNNALTTETDTLSYQLQIGARRWPERPVENVPETYMRFRQAAGVFLGSDDLAISPSDFHKKKRHLCN